MASRASTDWYDRVDPGGVRPSPSSSSTSLSSETWPGAPSNSKVWTKPSGDGVPWNTPWKPNSLPSGSRWM